MGIDLKNYKNVHFVGIGGIGMSSLAIILNHEGYKVTGSDMKDSDMTERLQGMGIGISIGHEASHINGADLIVYSAAVKPDNVELSAAKEKNILCIERSELLGLQMEQYQKSIAVTGTHGKTTTTSMISVVLHVMNTDPTVLIGGDVDLFKGNVKVGKSDLFVTEACEYVESFLKLSPYIGIILNVDEDHMDYYKNMDNLVKAFCDFARLVHEDGTLIIEQNCDYLDHIRRHTKASVTTFGIGDDADWYAEKIMFNKFGHSSFEVYYKGSFMGRVELEVPGLHNVQNALAALATIHYLNLDVKEAMKALKHFHGAHRRFQQKGTISGVTVVDDYAHHPTEIEATLTAAKNMDHNRLWCVFQPHLFSRTKALLHDFSKAFQMADKVIVTDIYPAREVDMGEISSRDLVQLMEEAKSDVFYIPSFFDVIDFLDKHLETGDIVITMGAGDIYQVGEELLKTGRRQNIDLSQKIKEEIEGVLEKEAEGFSPATALTT